MRLLLITIFTSMLLFTYSCKCNNEKSQSYKTAEYGDNLRDAIDKFEKQRQSFSNEMADIIEDTDDDLADAKPDLTEIADDWEKRWTKVTTDFEEVKTNFNTVGQNSAEYFNTLNNVVQGIQDENLRATELRKNQELKERWDKNYGLAENAINSMEKLLLDGNDFKRVLIASSIRQKLEENIEELKTISENAKALLNELETFTIEGKKLLN